MRSLSVCVSLFGEPKCVKVIDPLPEKIWTNSAETDRNMSEIRSDIAEGCRYRGVSVSRGEGIERCVKGPHSPPPSPLTRIGEGSK